MDWGSKIRELRLWGYTPPPWLTNSGWGLGEGKVKITGTLIHLLTMFVHINHSVGTAGFR